MWSHLRSQSKPIVLDNCCGGPTMTNEPCTVPPERSQPSSCSMSTLASFGWKLRQYPLAIPLQVRLTGLFSRIMFVASDWTILKPESTPCVTSVISHLHFSPISRRSRAKNNIEVPQKVWEHRVFRETLTHPGRRASENGMEEHKLSTFY